MSHKQRFSQLITILVILTQVLAGVSGALPPNVAYAAAAAPVSVQPPKPLEAVAERRSDTGALQAATHRSAPELVHTTAPEVVAAAVPAAPLLQSGAVAVGNTVWQDTNANGLQDSGEPGIPGVTVGLYDASGNAVLCTQAGRYDTYRDEFSTTGNTNSDGTLDWSSKAWVHTGTNIITTNGNPGGSLMIYGASTTANATRAVDLSVFVAPPTLSFDYNMNGIASKFNIQYSSDGGASFTTLAVLSDNGNGNVNPVTYFLPNTAANAQIRIQGQGTGYYAYFDNLTIRGQVRYPVTAVTDANGRYTFTAANCVQPNTNYQARIDTTQDAVIGLLLASPNAGGVTSNSPTLDDNDSDASMTTISGTPNAVINLTTPASGANYGYDFGFMPVAIGNRVWKDTNANGLQESGEPGLAGVIVGLYDASGNAVMCPQLGRYDTYRDEFSTTGATNSDGTLSWSSKAWVHTNTSISSSNGNPGGSLAIYGASPGFYATRAVDLSVFASKPTLSFDYNMQGAASKFNIQYSSNGGASFTTLAVLSDNKNGYKTITYTLPITVANAQIRIQGQGTGNWAYFDNLTIRGQVPYPVTTVTDANGLYTFTGVNCVQPSTAYQARIAMTQAALFGLLVTTQDAGGVTSNDPTLDDSDSDASLTTISGKAQAVVNATAPAGGANYSSDFGFAPVAIGNTVWKDLNANGLQDSGEPGIAGVTVGLYDASGNAVLCPPVGRYDTYLDQFSTTGNTNSNGTLDWSSKPWVHTNTSISSAGGNPGGLLQVSGGSTAYYATRSVDLAVFVRQPSLSFDYNMLGVASKFNIQYSSNGGTSFTTLAVLSDNNNGFKTITYTLPITVANAQIRIQGQGTGAYAYFDNIKVQGQLDYPVTAVTDANGQYSFTGVNCVQPSTTYQVRIATTQDAVVGLVLTAQDAGGVTSNSPTLDDSDSDASLTTISGTPNAVINLTTPAAGANYGYDFGFVPVEIGNKVWKDVNVNGLQDGGEPGLPGVTVGLYDAGGNAVMCTQVGRYDTYRDEFSTTGNTNSNGTLGWSSKPWVHTNTSISSSNGNPGGLLQIYGASTGYYATRAVDLSVFANKPTLSFDYNMQGAASKFNIQYSSNGGTSFTTLAVLSDNNNGYKTITYTLPITVANAQIRIQGQGTGTWAYFDNLTIRGQLRYPVTTVTDAKGFYTFTGANCVQPSTNYQVRIATTQNPLVGLALTTQNAGGVTSNSATDDVSDSDASLTTISGTPNAVISLTAPAAGVNHSYAFGFVPEEIGHRVWKDLNANGVQDSGEPGIAGVNMGLYDNGGNAVMCLQVGLYDTYRDDFSTNGNTNSDGTLDWSGKPWVHTGSMISGKLWVNGGSTTANATRAVDLAVFVAPPTLSFDYDMNGTASKFNIQYSSNGGTSFTTLAVLSDNNTGYKTITYTLPLTVANAQIRIQGTGTGSWAYFDNLMIRGKVRHPVTAVTDANGLYTFTGANCVQPSTNYQVRIDTTQLPLMGLVLTTPNVGGVTSNDPTLDVSDSDASLTTINGTPNAVISLTAPAAGVNDSYAFGFVPVEIGNRVWKDLNANGLQDSGEPGIAGVNMGLYDDSGNAVMCTQVGRYDTYRDEFSLPQYTSYGTLDWSSKPWVYTGSPYSTNALLIYAAGPNNYATRAVDLSVFVSPPTLSFDYSMSGAALTYNILYSSNGGTSFTTLAALSDNNSAYKTITYTLPITVANAQIRIQATTNSLVTAYFDNITIRGQVRHPVTTVTNNNGYYTFTGVQCLQPNTTYQVQIDTGQITLNGLSSLTTPNAGGVTSNDPLTDVTDSDAASVTRNNLPYARVTATAPAAGVNYSYAFGFVPDAGALVIRKAAAPAGGNQRFAFTSNVPGYTSFTINSGGSLTIPRVPVGVYTVTEIAPSGWTQGSATCSNGNGLTYGTGAILVSHNLTTTCSILNAIQPTATNTLTVTKIVNWNGNMPQAGQPFQITLTGPSFPSGKADTITAGQTNVYTNVLAGVYTVTETSPAAGWVTTYTVNLVNSTTGAVVNLGGPTTTPTTAGPISGRVYQDFTSNGQIDNSAGTMVDVGVPGMTVVGYDPNGVVVGTATTNAYGNYSFTPDRPGPYRVELQTAPTGYYPTTHGADNGTSTQFVMTNGGATKVDFGINIPANYSQNNPSLVSNVYIEGPADAAFQPNGPVLIGFPYDSRGNTPAATTLAMKPQLGSTWGLTYARSTKTLYAAAYIRQNVGLGPNGPGAIYQLNMKGGAPTLFADLAVLGIDVGTVLPDALRGYGSGDSATYPLVSTAGLGGIDLSDDEKTIYVVSLKDKTLYELTVPDGALGPSHVIPDPGCVGGEWRPFALKYKIDSLYIGGVCDASASQNGNDLVAHIYRFTPATNTFTDVLNFSLNFDRKITSFCYSVGWHPWLVGNAQMPACGGSSSYPQPILSDIEVDVDGSLMLGFIDRTGDQGGAQSGDILRATPNGAGYSLVTIVPVPGTAVATTDFYNDMGMDTAPESALGGLTFRPGSGEVATTFADPVTTYSNGVRWLSNATGSMTNGYTYVFGRLTIKGHGLGDLELLTDPAPLEIGNRVWKDLNGNGVQDPGEPGIANVTVALQSPTNTLTTNTDANGLYYFNVIPNTTYTLTINPSQTPLNGLSLTQANMQALSGSTFSNDPFLDTRDSDAVALNGKAAIIYTTGLAGQNNHGLDFGWSPTVSGKVIINNKAPHMDWGDNPDQYDTTITNTGAAHLIVPGLYLGVGEDSETDGQPTAAANGDGADEDGVQFPLLKAGSTAVLTVTATNTGTTAATLYGWIDFNGDGQFAASERVTKTVPAGTTNGLFYLTYNVPANAVRATYARFRLSTDPAAAQPTGVALNGEVEDYPVTIEAPFVQFGDRVWLESDTDGLASTGVITPIVGLVITATDSSGVARTATTNNAGYYSFTVPVDTYTVTYGRVPVSYGVTAPSATSGGSSAAGNAGSYQASGLPDQSHANGTIVTLSNGEANWHIDFAFHNVVQIGNRLWLETDNDGDATTGLVSPVVGQVVTATSRSGVVYTATTDSKGLYTLTVPANAVYTVTTGTPAGAVPSTVLTNVANATNAVANDNKNHLNTGTTVTVGTTDNWSVDFGFHLLLGQFGDRVWLESDTDGLVSTGVIIPIAGMVITATDSRGAAQTTTTNSAGYYSFTVPVGAYTVTYGSVPVGYGVTTPSATPGGSNEVGNAGSYQASGLPDQSHANGTTVTVTDGQANWHIDFAFHNLVKIGNRLWIETDSDGDATTGSVTPVAGQVVTATSRSGVVYTATTDSKGLYTLTVPANAVYTVTTGTPAMNMPSVYNGAPGNDQSHNPSGTRVVVGVTDDLTIDFGFHALPVQFGDRVWLESDADGLASTGVITPIVGMVITATDSSGVAQTTTTNSAGYYSFTLPIGTYAVTYGRVPTGYGLTAPSATPGGDSEVGNAGSYQASGLPDQSHANGTIVTLSNGEANWHIDFAFHNVVQIGNRLWFETDNDGDATTGLVSPVVGQVVTATSRSGVVYTATTDSNGLYTLTVPTNAIYTVTTGTPAGATVSVYSSAPGDNQSHNPSGTRVVVGVTNDLNIDFGFHAPLAQFGDRVWLESDTDGLASTGVITPVAGIVITARDNNGLVRLATTNSAGYYSFTVPVGTYTVTYGSVPAGYGVTAPSATPGGSSEAGNAGSYRQSGLPDQSHANGMTVTLSDGEANWHIDFAFHNLVKIGNRLWIETDSDGDATTGSVTPVAGQVVTATSSSGVVYTATTDSNGLYTITVPANAVYTVTTGTPAGNTPSVYNGTPGDNQSHNPGGTRVVAGTIDNLTSDFGFHALPAQFGDRVWLESDTDGLASTGVITPIAGIVITATDGTHTYTATTTAQGYYSFTVPPGLYSVSYGSVPAQYGVVSPSATPGGGTAYGNEGSYQETGNPDENYTNRTYVGLATGETNWHVDFAFHNLVHIGNRLWIEADSDGDATTGRVLPVVGQVVTATSRSGVVYTATTDSKGLYTLTVPANAVYTVTTGTPAGTVASTVFTNVANATNAAANDNKNHLNTGTTVTVGTTDNRSVDFGFSQPVTNWPGTLVVRKAAPTFTNCINVLNSSVLDPNVNNNTACVSTSIVPPAALGVNFTFTDTVQTSQGVVTPTFALQMGEAITFTNVIAGAYVVTETQQAGWQLADATCSNGDDPQQVAVPPGVTVTCTFTNTPATLQFGDRVWVENDGDGRIGATEPITPVAGLRLTATASDGAVYTATTNALGYYSFTVPANLTYTVRYGTVPASYGAVIPSATPGGSRESGNAGVYAEHGNPDVSHAQGTTVTLDTHEANWQVDFAFWVPQPRIHVTKYTNGDDADLPTGPTVNVGSVVTWTYVITNTGNVTLTNVILVDDQEGSVTCPQAQLAPGDVMTCRLTGTAKAGPYANTAVVTGTPTLGTPTPVTDTNPSHYLGLTAGLGDRVWFDANHNGTQDLGENGVPNVTVELLNSSGGVISTTTTSASGYYSFTDLAPGVYAVRFVTSTLPTGYQLTAPNRGNDSTADSDADVSTGKTASISLVGNQYDPTWDAGIWLPQPSVLLKKYTNGYDADAATGPYLAVGQVVTWTYTITNTGNVTLTNIQLRDNVEGRVVCTPTTLVPGAGASCTQTGITQAGQYSNTAVVTGTPTLGPVTPVTSTNPSHYFGANPALVLKKYTNGPGGTPTDADTLSDARPHLRLGDPVTWTYVITNTGNVPMSFAANSLKDDKEGVILHAAFTLLPGERMTFTKQGMVTSVGVYTNTGSLAGVPDVPPPGTPDLPNFPPANPPTTPITPTNPSHYDAVGLSLGNRLWVDNGAGTSANRDNGRYDAGEPAAPQGIAVELLDITGTVLLTTTTDSNGYYRFDNLAVGSYQVRIPAREFAAGGKLAGYASSTGQTTAFATADNNVDHGDDAELNGVKSAVVTLGASNPTGDADSGATAAGSNGPSGDANDNLSVDFGFVPMATFGNFVWIESDSDGLASTGVITPVGGMVLTATDSLGLVYTTTTDPNGYYTFSVPAAVYTVTYGSVPSSYGAVVPSATPNSGAADKNNPGTDQASRPNHTVVSLTPGDNLLTIDFGFYPPLSQFGDRVWLESDNDGLANTAVLTAVVGLAITATNNSSGAVYTTTTDANGYYSFTVPAGTYTVRYGHVPASYGPVTSSSTPGGSSETGKAGSYQQSGNPDQSHANGTTVTVAAGEANWHVDFAFVPQADLQLVKTADQRTLRTGATLTYVLTLTNKGRFAVPNVKVTDRLPATVQYQAATPAQGTYDANTGVWDVGTVAANQTLTLTITVQVK